MAHVFALGGVLLLGPRPLVGRVSLPRQEERVSQACELERLPDGGTPVRHAIVWAGPHAGLDLIEDPLGVLRPWVVGGGDGDVGEPRRGGTHRSSLAAVAVAPGA